MSATLESDRAGAHGIDAPESPISAVSWSAIAAGGIAAAALSLILLAFGAGVGFSSVSPWSAGAASTGFRVGTGLYFIVTAMLSSAVGGYLAGRLRTRWPGVHSREVFFRDTAHGFLAWGFATLLSAAALGSASSAIVGAKEVGSHPEVNLVLPAPSQETSDTASAERSYPDQARSDQLAAARARLIQAEQAARRAAAQFSLWLAASLLVGALAASLAAIEGGGLRDGTWRYRV